MDKEFTLFKIQRGFKSALRVPETFLIAGSLAAINVHRYGKGPEDKSRATEVAIISAVSAAVCMGFINSINVLVYNRRPNQNTRRNKNE